MGLFMRQKKSEILVLIDIGADSVAGAYAERAEGVPVTLHYTRRLPIELRRGEPHAAAMLRALGVLGEALQKEGAPVLLRARGSAAVDTILVSIDAPWQTTSVRTETLEQSEPFTFTKSLVTAALEKTRSAPEGQLVADESIIGTILNGYETRDPYGKKTKRAAIVILTSLIDHEVATHIRETLRGFYRAHTIDTIAGSSLRYQAICIAFPHERDALLLDATGVLTTLALVRRDLLVDVTEVAAKTNAPKEWLAKTGEALAALAKRFPLPRTIFLLARETEVATLRETLEKGSLGSLWLSDNPPKIVAVLGSHVQGAIKSTSATPDLPLLLLALYAGNREAS